MYIYKYLNLCMYIYIYIHVLMPNLPTFSSIVFNLVNLVVCWTGSHKNKKRE